MCNNICIVMSVVDSRSSWSPVDPYTTQSKSAYLKGPQRGQGAEHPFPPLASWGHKQMTGALKQRWS